MNELVFLLMTLISLDCIYLFYKYLKNDGLYIWLIISYLLSFILSFKLGILFNFDVMINIPVYLSAFLCLYLIMEKDNKFSFKQLSLFIVFISLVTSIYLLFTINYNTSIGDNNSINLGIIMQSNYYSVYLFSIVFIIDLFLTKFIYLGIREYYNNLFISYSVTNILVQLFDSCLLLVVFYLNTGEIFISVIVGSYICKLIISFCYYFLLQLLCGKKKVKR